MMEYLSIKQTSEKWGITVRRIQVLCAEGRIPGATKIGSYWAIPADAEKPNDQRIKSGKYIKKNIQEMIRYRTICTLLKMWGLMELLSGRMKQEKYMNPVRITKQSRLREA